jgi:Gene product 88
MDKLTFGLGNAKLSSAIGTFSLPAGHSCPFAKECLSKANRLTGKIIDGQHCRFRCFAASQEMLFPTVRNARWRNFDLLRKTPTIESMAELIQKSLPWGINIIHVHVSGDFYSDKYFLAWLNVAYNNPHITFYGYTKATPLMVKYKKYFPSNFRFTASKGGTCDSLIAKHKLKSAEVVFSVQEAKDKGLEIDHDDSHAFGDSGSFALLLHGQQKAGTPARAALTALEKEGIMGYGKHNTFRKEIESSRNLVIYVTLKNGDIVLPQKAKKNIGIRKSVNPLVKMLYLKKQVKA